MTRAAIYARVSTNAQDPEPQLAALKEYVKRRGWALEGEYVDVASGGDTARANLRRMYQDAFKRNFDVLVVWKFDRLARSVRDLLRALETFDRLKIEFVSLTEALDTATPTGKFTFSILASVAELERDLIKERISLGIQAARAKGKRHGRPVRRVNEEKVRIDYQTLRSLKKTAKLHGCSTWLIASIVSGERNCKNKPALLN